MRRSVALKCTLISGCHNFLHTDCPTTLQCIVTFYCMSYKNCFCCSDIYTESFRCNKEFNCSHLVL